MNIKLISRNLGCLIITIILITTPVSLTLITNRKINSFIQYKNNLNLNNPPGDFYLTSDAESSEFDNSFNLSWTNSYGADNYSILYYNHFIYEFNNSLFILINQSAISPYKVQMPNMNEETLYFVIIAYNESGYTLSNCISVYFDFLADIFLDPIFFLILFIGIVTISTSIGIWTLIQKRRGR